jgi:predicted alpha/beta-hydrolase family hydrolase
MNTKKVSIVVSDEIGKVSGEYFVADGPICLMTLAHGAGAGMNHEFMVKIANALAAEGITTLRFNFPFMESKKGRPDSPKVAHATIDAAVRQAQIDFPSLPLFLSGKSFGGRMSSQYLSNQTSSDASGIIFYGFPLHQSGNPSIDRAEHLQRVKVPMLFLQGTRDELATFDLIKEVSASLKLATLVPIENANHAFKAGKTDVMSILVSESKKWIEKRLKKSKEAI